MGYSLWLVPNPSVASKLESIMRLRPPTPLRSALSFPSFHPHLTLASSPSPAVLAAALPTLPLLAPAPVPVRFKALVVGAQYFMSVFVEVHAPGGSALEAVRAGLRAGGAAVPAVPHLSLFYVDGPDREEGAGLVRRLESELRVMRRVGEGEDGEETVVLVSDRDGEGGEGREAELELLDGFEGEEVWMVRCEGNVAEWEVLEKLSLVHASE